MIFTVFIICVVMVAIMSIVWIGGQPLAEVVHRWGDAFQRWWNETPAETFARSLRKLSFERLPGVEWKLMKNGREIVYNHHSEELWLDNILVVRAPSITQIECLLLAMEQRPLKGG